MPISRNVVKKKTNIQSENANLSSAPKRRGGGGGSLLSKQCHYCDRKFSKAEHLKRHERSRKDNRYWRKTLYMFQMSKKFFKKLIYDRKNKSDVLIRHLKNHPQLPQSPSLPTQLSIKSAEVETGNQHEHVEQIRPVPNAVIGSKLDKLYVNIPDSASKKIITTTSTTTTTTNTTTAASLPSIPILDHQLSESDPNNPHHFPLHSHQPYHHNLNDNNSRPALPLPSGLDHLATLASWQDYGSIDVEIHDSLHDISAYGPRENWNSSHYPCGISSANPKRNIQIDPNLDPRLTQSENLFGSSKKND